MSAVAIPARGSRGARIFAAPSPWLAYGVGFRVFTDRRLLAQIWDSIFHNVMQPEQIARLENVSAEVLAGLIEEHVMPAGPLRAYAAEHPGCSVLAWRTTRKHLSKLHLLDDRGVALCGTPIGGEPLAVHDGPCSTCAAYAGSPPEQGGERSGGLERSSRPVAVLRQH
jgi:hypothetical protein